MENFQRPRRLPPATVSTVFIHWMCLKLTSAALWALRHAQIGSLKNSRTREIYEGLNPFGETALTDLIPTEQGVFIATPYFHLVDYQLDICVDFYAALKFNVDWKIWKKKPSLKYIYTILKLVPLHKLLVDWKMSLFQNFDRNVICDSFNELWCAVTVLSKMLRADLKICQLLSFT